jgi:hypothetical protein
MNKMKVLIGAVALAAVGMASAADLTILGPSPSNNLPSGQPIPDCTGTNGGQDSTFLTSQCSVSSTGLELLYKFNIGGQEDGLFQGLFSSTGLTAPGTMTLTDTFAGALTGYTSFWLVVKDGNADPGRYGYNITSNWAGDGFIQLNDFWTNPDRGEISHVALFGAGGGCTTDCFNEVPEPGSLGLAGLALLGAGLARRRVKR